MSVWTRQMTITVLVVTATIGVMPRTRADARPAAAQASDDAVMKAYVLDAAKVNGYLSAGEALVAARKADRTVAADMRAMAEASTDTLAQTRAQFKARPRIFEFFQKTGLSLEDVVLIPRVLLAAGVAAQFPSAAGIASPAQVAFVKQHPAVLTRFEKLNEALEEGDDAPPT